MLFRPNRFIVALAFIVPTGGVQAAPSDAYAARADALVRDYARADLFSGVVLVARHGKPVLRKGFGAAGREWGVPNTPDTRFHIGSVTKQFTAAAVLRLVDEGKLALDDPIGTYVKDLPARWQGATIRQLLQHSAGIPRYTGLDDFDDRLVRVARTPRQILDLVKDAPLDFAPGTRFEYDNTGYVLLGCLVEAVSGMRYQDYLERRLLAPLHLAHSGYDDGRRIIDHAALAYTDGAGGEVRRAPLADISNAYAAGAMFATADDLLAWQAMLAGGRVLSPASTAAMFTDGGHGYGFGWFIRQRFGRKVYEHGGNWQGFNTMLAYYPDDQLTVIVLGNHGDVDVDKIAGELAGLAFGVPAAHRAVRVDARQAARIAGRYQLAPDTVLTVVRRGGRTYARLTGQRELDIYPEGRNRYFFKAVDAQLSFDDATAGPAGYVVLHQNGAAMKAARIE